MEIIKVNRSYSEQPPVICGAAKVKAVVFEWMLVLKY